MFPIPAGIVSGLKIFAVLAIISSVGYGIKWVYDKHLDAIDNAVNQAKLETALIEQQVARKATEELKAQQQAERLAMQAELDRARANADNLRRMLTIDHDLDRLLQRKPGLILPRVNEGTEEVLLELEELTR
jgi:hypothetical protein